MREYVGAVVVAAGRSSRMGHDKVWARLGDWCVVEWSVRAIEGAEVVDRLALVVAADRLDRAPAAMASFGTRGIVVPGGSRRRDSVAAGVAALEDCRWIVVHDAARPFVTPDLVRRGVKAARETGAAVAAVQSRDTIKRVAGLDVVETLLRSELWIVQTPQVFRRDILVEALASTDDDVTDEATLVERMGGTVRVFEGSAANFKITTPADLELARAVVEHSSRRVDE